MIKVKYGANEKAASSLGGLSLIGSGTLIGGNNDTVGFALSQYHAVLLCTEEINHSAGTVRGARIRLLVRPDNGNTFTSYNVYNNSSSGVTITLNSDQSVTIAPSGTGYDVYYALYALI